MPGPEFHPWSALHNGALIATAVIVLSLCLGGRYLLRRDPSGASERRARHIAAWILLALQIPKNAWWMWPTRFDIQKSLPLQVCDLLELLLPVALLLPSRLKFACLWYFGVGLSTQAFITPVLVHGPGDPRFWMFWHAHAAVLAGAVYAVSILKYRPTLRDFCRVALIGLVYAGVATAVNLSVDANYGFMGNQIADHPTLVDHLGPWPWRAVWLMLLAMVAMLLTWVPFGFIHIFNGSRSIPQQRDTAE